MSSTDETKGGIILAKLIEKQKNNNVNTNNPKATLSVCYQDSQGNMTQSEEIVDFTKMINANASHDDYFDNNGIRKGVLLTRYVELLHQWIDSVNNSTNKKDSENKEDDGWNYDWEKERNGSVTNVKPNTPVRSEWERSGQNLHVTDEYKQKFDEFKNHFINEMTAIGDETLQQEIDILDQLITYKPHYKDSQIYDLESGTFKRV